MSVLEYEILFPYVEGSLDDHGFLVHVNSVKDVKGLFIVATYSITNKIVQSSYLNVK